MPQDPMMMYQGPTMSKGEMYAKKFNTQEQLRVPGVEILYSEQSDGDITIEIEPVNGLRKLVTAIDISSLYKEKRNKAILLAKKFEQLYHEYLLSPLSPVILDGSKLYFQTEAPENGSTCWKAFCKKKFNTVETLVIFRQMCNVLNYIHKNDIIHRDVHPTRFHLVNGKAKFNFIGMPYNYKKLLKKDNFSGHINYSAPELILESLNFSDKVDIWSLGCCLYFLVVKKDPFEGKDPKTIKENILTCNIDYDKTSHEPLISELIQACLIVDESKRPHAFELLNYLNQIEVNTYGRIVSDDKLQNNLSFHASSFNSNISPNTSGSFSKSFENSFSSDKNSFDYSTGQGENPKFGTQKGMHPDFKTNKLSSKSK